MLCGYDIQLDMEEYSNVVVSAAEFIKERLYFVTLETKEQPKSTACTHYFSIEEHLQYESFFSDFGPLNLSMLYHYCTTVNRKLNSNYLKSKKIVHISTDDTEKRLNAACLIASYGIIYLDMSPQQAYTILNFSNRVPFINFRDASVGTPYTISLMDVLCGIHKAHNLSFFNFKSFNYVQYEHYERVENGDLNWIIPGKMLGFCGPHNKSRTVRGYPLHAPEFYFKYFRKHNVTTIVRLNKKMYDASKFSNAGFEHQDLYFLDGSVPTDKILNDFLNISEKTDGAIAVHCKAGLGRTGTLIGCYLMKHYMFTAREAIAWIRICRPGSVIGHQQEWLEMKESQMWKEGDAHRRKKGLSGPPKHSYGVYDKNEEAEEEEKKIKSNDNVSGILKKVDTMKLNDKDDNKFEEEQESYPTQGDKLNQIKAQRRQPRPLATGSTYERKVFRSKILVNSLETTPVVNNKTTKVSPSLNATTSTSTKVLLKKDPGDPIPKTELVHTRGSETITRNETNEIHQNNTPRRISQRKSTHQVAPITVDKAKSLTKRNENRWFLEEPKKEDDKKDFKSIKRGKRALNSDKDKSSPRSIKVLRRSLPQTIDDTGKTRQKVTLPVVKLGKTF